MYVPEYRHVNVGVLQSKWVGLCY